MKKIVTITYTKNLFGNEIDSNKRGNSHIEFLNNRRVKGESTRISMSLISIDYYMPNGHDCQVYPIYLMYFFQFNEN
jgi:hypothetical protein